MKRKQVVIKVGSSLAVRDGYLTHLCRQIAILMKDGNNVALVSSGAVAHDQVDRRSKNLRAAIGQSRLMSRYINSFEDLGLAPAQMLLTKHDLDDPVVLIKTLTEAMHDAHVVPIINANDVVDSEELQALGLYADNDRLFSRVVKLLNADVAMIGIDQLGLLNAELEVVRNVTMAEKEQALAWARGGSRHGHGSQGMLTKLKVLFDLCASGQRCALVPALAPAAFIDVNARLNGSLTTAELGTVFHL